MGDGVNGKERHASAARELSPNAVAWHPKELDPFELAKLMIDAAKEALGRSVEAWPVTVVLPRDCIATATEWGNALIRTHKELDIGYMADRADYTRVVYLFKRVAKGT